MWNLLLYLSCLLYLVHPINGYFYKENTVSDNDKQCFCEVRSWYFVVSVRWQIQVDNWNLQWSKKSPQYSLIPSWKATSTTARVIWTLWTTSTTSRSIHGSSPYCGTITFASTRPTWSSAAPFGRTIPSAPWSSAVCSRAKRRTCPKELRERPRPRVRTTR